MRRWWQRLFKKETPSPTTQAVIDLIRDAPEQWRSTPHWFEHSGGLKIWDSEYVWALQIEVPRVGRVLDQGRGCKASVDHKALRKAIDEWKGGRPGHHSLTDYVSAAMEHQHKARLEAISRATDADIQNIYGRIQ